MAGTSTRSLGVRKRAQPTRPLHCPWTGDTGGEGGWGGVWRGQMVEREGLLWEGARSERRGSTPYNCPGPGPCLDHGVGLGRVYEGCR